MRKRKSTFSFLSFFCLLIMLAIFVGIINAIPEGGSQEGGISVHPAEESVIVSTESRSYKDGMYHLTTRQLMNRMGMAAVFGAIVGFFFSRQALHFFYRKTLQKCVDEILYQQKEMARKKHLSAIKGEGGK